MKEERKGKRVERELKADLHPVGEAEVRFLPLGQPAGKKGEHLRLSESEAAHPGQFERSQNYTKFCTVALHTPDRDAAEIWSVGIREKSQGQDCC